MRVLIANDYATATGGAELGSLRLREVLRQRDHAAALFASDARPGGLPVEADYTCYGTIGPHRTLLQSANPSALRGIAAAIRSFEPDVVHVRMFLTQLSPTILRALETVPSLLQVTTYRPICPVATKRLPDGSACHAPPGAVCLREGCVPAHDWVPLMLQHRSWASRRDAFDLVVANSDWVARRLRADGMEVDGALRYGIPDRGARPPLVPPPTMAYAGRLVPEKGVEVLLRATALLAERLPRVRLLVVGEGPEEERLRGLTTELGLEERVRFLGRVERERVTEVLAPAWVQVVPSVWEEPFGLVAAEAMMRGTAVVASDTGGLTEQVIEGRTGMLVPPDDAGALARAVLPLLGDRETAERLGGEARQVAVERFSEDRYVDDVIGLYRRIAG